MFQKCTNLVSMNEYGTERKTNISACRFWTNKSFVWYFFRECLFRFMEGMHETRCIYFSEPYVLNCSEVTCMGYKAQYHAFVWSGIFKSDMNQNIDHWKCVTVYTLRFTLRPGSLTLRSSSCYVTVHTRISNQASCVKTKPRRRYSAPQLYSQQSKLLIPMWK